MTAERGMAEVAASAAREMEALAATMADVAQELRRWQINGEGLPPIQDLRQTVRALQGLTVRVAEIEEDTTNRARAEGESWTPSPGIPFQPGVEILPAMQLALEVLTSQRTSLEEQANAITGLRRAMEECRGRRAAEGGGAMRDAKELVATAEALVREMALMMVVGHSAVEGLEMWRLGHETYPPMSDLRQLVLALGRIARDFEDIETDVIAIEHAAGLPCRRA